MTYEKLNILPSLLQLWTFEGLGVIIQVSSGVFYTNQTGGYACFHPSSEGCFLPIESGFGYQTKMLYDYFSGPKYNRGCTRCIDNKDADFIDEVLEISSTYYLFVDRDKLNDSHEAWVYVTINKHPNKYNEDNSMLYGLNGKKGVLTWLNSD